METYTFTITYKISCEDISLNKEETYTVEHDNPLTAWQPVHRYCCDLSRKAEAVGCTITPLVVKDENGKVEFEWK